MFFKQKQKQEQKSKPPALANDQFKQLFGGGEERDADRFYEDYTDTERFNFAAVVAARLANITCTDASAYVDGAEFMQNAFAEAFGQSRLAVETAFGCGGVILKPYVYNGKLLADVLPQNRLYVLEKAGGTVTKAALLCDQISLAGSKDEFVRAEVHGWNGDIYKVANRCFKYDKGRDRIEEVGLSAVDAWKNIDGEVMIPDDGGFAGKMLFAHLKSPVVNRAGDMMFGAPVTYAQDELIGIIRVLMGEIPDEYRNKKAFIGADSLLFDKNNRLPESGLYKLFRGGVSVDTQGFWEVFSPQIRHESYIEGIRFMMSLLEKGIGVNRGILTDLDNVNSTATAIRRGTFDTFALADMMRRNVEAGFSHLVDCFDFIARGFDLYPEAEKCKPVFEWSYGLIEDTSETVAQFREGYHDDVIGKDEYRRQITGEKYHGNKK